MKKQLFKEMNNVPVRRSFREYLFELEEVINLFNKNHGTQFDTTELLTEYFNKQD